MLADQVAWSFIRTNRFSQEPILLLLLLLLCWWPSTLDHFHPSSCQNWWQFHCAPRRNWQNIFHPVNFNICTFLLCSEFFLFWGHLTPGVQHESRCTRSESSNKILAKAEARRIITMMPPELQNVKSFTRSKSSKAKLTPRKARKSRQI